MSVNLFKDELNRVHTRCRQIKFDIDSAGSKFQIVPKNVNTKEMMEMQSFTGVVPYKSPQPLTKDEMKIYLQGIANGCFLNEER